MVRGVEMENSGWIKSWGPGRTSGSGVFGEAGCPDGFPALRELHFCSQSRASPARFATWRPRA